MQGIFELKIMYNFHPTLPPGKISTESMRSPRHQRDIKSLEQFQTCISPKWKSSWQKIDCFIATESRNILFCVRPRRIESCEYIWSDMLRFVFLSKVIQGTFLSNYLFTWSFQKHCLHSCWTICSHFHDKTGRIYYLILFFM